MDSVKKEVKAPLVKGEERARNFKDVFGKGEEGKGSGSFWRRRSIIQNSSKTLRKKTMRP